jgi:hypothetical protein
MNDNKGPKLPLKEKQNLVGQTTIQIRTIIYSDEAAPWSRSIYLWGT